MEKKEISSALREAQSVRGAAALLGTSPTNLKYWMDKLDIESPSSRPANTVAAWTRDELLDAVSGAVSKRQVLQRLGRRDTGSIYATLQRAADMHGVHLPDGTRKVGGVQVRMPASEVFAEGVNRHRQTLLWHLVNSAGRTYECESCKNPGEWQGEPLCLEIDHVNGNHRDNRLENLRFLCPNCHSQAETSSRQS